MAFLVTPGQWGDAPQMIGPSNAPDRPRCPRRHRRAAVRRGPNLHYLDGLDLYGESDHDEFPLPDSIHPSPEGHLRIGENFTKLVFANGPFAPTSS